eukprot:CAMPEP_0175670778 /NCGR_PEP_ID=MMETSP0097-20121207/19839_1 /TAXON_ID=311494 /ORGANISM="Alexandrium monilatum, Strain CCMP3105" /LENGTH=118 /DNA_ID=CAMNT_0016977371 /DNA_START=160 /DNA_END=512 /DNA_ORIENTATION=+
MRSSRRPDASGSLVAASGPPMHPQEHQSKTPIGPCLVAGRSSTGLAGLCPQAGSSARRSLTGSSSDAAVLASLSCRSHVPSPFAPAAWASMPGASSAQACPAGERPSPPVLGLLAAGS